MNELELYHHGVKGMRWGVRKKRTSSSGGSSAGNKVKKVVQNRIQKVNEKEQRRQESYNKTAQRFGVGGVALRSTVEYSRKKAAKGMAVKLINSAANSYISEHCSNYRVSRGVDFVRRASISALSLSSYIDMGRAASNIGKAINNTYDAHGKKIKS